MIRRKLRRIVLNLPLGIRAKLRIAKALRILKVPVEGETQEELENKVMMRFMRRRIGHLLEEGIDHLLEEGEEDEKDSLSNR